MSVSLGGRRGPVLWSRRTSFCKPHIHTATLAQPRPAQATPAAGLLYGAGLLALFGGGGGMSSASASGGCFRFCPWAPRAQRSRNSQRISFVTGCWMLLHTAGRENRQKGSYRRCDDGSGHGQRPTNPFAMCFLQLDGKVQKEGYCITARLSRKCFYKPFLSCDFPQGIDEASNLPLDLKMPLTSFRLQVRFFLMFSYVHL